MWKMRSAQWWLTVDAIATASVHIEPFKFNKVSNIALCLAVVRWYGCVNRSYACACHLPRINFVKIVLQHCVLAHIMVRPSTESTAMKIPSLRLINLIKCDKSERESNKHIAKHATRTTTTSSLPPTTTEHENNNNNNRNRIARHPTQAQTRFSTHSNSHSELDLVEWVSEWVTVLSSCHFVCDLYSFTFFSCPFAPIFLCVQWFEHHESCLLECVLCAVYANMLISVEEMLWQKQHSTTKKEKKIHIGTPQFRGDVRAHWLATAPSFSGQRKNWTVFHVFWCQLMVWAHKRPINVTWPYHHRFTIVDVWFIFIFLNIEWALSLLPRSRSLSGWLYIWISMQHMSPILYNMWIQNIHTATHTQINCDETR